MAITHPYARHAIALLLAVLSVSCSKNDDAARLIEAAREGDLERCERLVKGGISVNAWDSEGATALDWAIFDCKPDVVGKLIGLGADVNHVTQFGRTPLMFTVVTLRGRELRGTKAQRAAIAKLLIDAGADVNHGLGDGSAAGHGATALHYAASDKNLALVRILLQAGADPRIKSNQGYTALDVAKFPDYAPNDEVIDALTSASERSK